MTSFVTERQRSTLTVLVALGLLGYAALMFGQAVRDRRRADRTQATDGSPVPVRPAPVEQPVEVSS